MNIKEIQNKLSLGIPLSMLNLKVAYYSRVSTDHLEQQHSLQNQIFFFEDMIQNNQHWIMAGRYIDEGITGTSILKRNSFLKMLHDAKEGKFDLLLTKEISRFSRNTLDSIKYTRELLSYGVAVLFINDNINTALPDAELRLTIMASLAQDEIRRLSERVKFGMQRAIEKGVILGHNHLYGYLKDQETGNLIINEEEADNVRIIFKLYGEYKYSLAMITKYLNNHGIKTNRNNKWCSSTILRMLKNPKYKGYYCGRKTKVDNYMHKKINILSKDQWIIYQDYHKIPPIIEEELWNRVNDRFNSQYHPRNQFLKKISFDIICAHDQEHFYQRKIKNDTVWSCSKYLKDGKNNCHCPHIRESELEIIFEDIISIFKIDYSKIEHLLNNIYEKNYHPHQQLKRIILEKEQIIKRKEELGELFLKSLINKNTFMNYTNKCDLVLKKINRNIDKISLLKMDYLQRIHELQRSSTFNYKIINLLVEKLIVVPNVVQL